MSESEKIELALTMGEWQDLVGLLDQFAANAIDEPAALASVEDAMSEKMRPALTPEEWARVKSDGMEPGPTLVGELPYLSESDRHIVAALALHGHPFGFTWEMVRALRSILDRARGEPECLPEWAAEDEELAGAAIANIEALLPPREEA